MPRLSLLSKVLTFKTSSIVVAFDQIMEGVEHLHNLRIAHGGVFGCNVVAATEEDAQRDMRVTAGKVYLIDFESCRQFALGPGVQGAVPVPPAHIRPPLGLKSFDPFSWDVYCLGATLEVILQEKFFCEPQSQPWILRWYAQWLKGNEVGCTAACHCRPRIRRARQVLASIRLIVDVGEVVQAVVTFPTVLSNSWLR
ncbi:hypothetical protein BD311DRAFT_676702 [Dichomitus squalens]|uniref:Protein kinase domain-containing protein n=1 Tax=Dichomitus squalens TaxID=114155 RepID=A0A4Q9M5E1_9APHY|nr:hypothetical protein BD311DRAFT_676702 [Dichomitus squalens]